MIVCQCHGVTDREIRAGHPGRAGHSCSGCVSEVQRITEESPMARLAVLARKLGLDVNVWDLANPPPLHLGYVLHWPSPELAWT